MWTIIISTFICYEDGVDEKYRGYFIDVSLSYYKEILNENKKN